MKIKKFGENIQKINEYFENDYDPKFELGDVVYVKGTVGAHTFDERGTVIKINKKGSAYFRNNKEWDNGMEDAMYHGAVYYIDTIKYWVPPYVLTKLEDANNARVRWFKKGRLDENIDDPFNEERDDVDYSKKQMACAYSFFIKKGGYTPEYVENISKLPFDERYEHELSKVRVNIVLTAGHFFISDRVEGASDTIKEAVKYTTAQKMKQEAEFFEDESMLNSIPELDFLSKDQEPREITLEQQLAQAIEEEDYMEAARIRDEIAKNSK